MPRSVDQTPAALVRLRQSPRGRYRYVRTGWHALFWLIDAVGGAVFAIAHALRHIVAPGAAAPHTGETRRILLVQLDHLGDAVISTALLAPLRRAYPQAEIHVLASPRSAAVLGAADIDRLYVWDGYRFEGRRWWQWCWGVFVWGLRLQHERFDLGLDVRGELPLAALLWLAGVPRRVGWACGGGRFLLSASAEFVAGRPEIESRRALLAAAGVAVGKAERLAPVWRHEPSAARAIAEWLDALPDDGQPLVVIHVGAGTAAKRWPVEHFRQLAQKLLTHDVRPLTLVLVGSNDDRLRSAHVARSLNADRVHDWTGQLSLGQLAALCRRAALLIGADSGPAHLAAAVGAPVLALFSGANDSRQWRPAGDRVIVLKRPTPCGPCHRHECPWSDHPCMTEISPGRVFAAALSVLQPIILHPSNDGARDAPSEPIAFTETCPIEEGASR